MPLVYDTMLDAHKKRVNAFLCSTLYDPVSSLRRMPVVLKKIVSFMPRPNRDDHTFGMVIWWSEPVQAEEITEGGDRDGALITLTRTAQSHMEARARQLGCLKNSDGSFYSELQLRAYLRDKLYQSWLSHVISQEQIDSLEGRFHPICSLPGDTVTCGPNPRGGVPEIVCTRLQPATERELIERGRMTDEHQGYFTGFAKNIRNHQLEELRFANGQRVVCCVDHNLWYPGTIVDLWYVENEVVAPYQIELDNGDLIYAPQDIDALIQADEDDTRAETRYAVGDHVLCHMGEEDEWQSGTIVGKWHHRGADDWAPYEIELDNGGGSVSVPADNDKVIRVNE